MALRWGMLRLSVQTNILSLDQQDTFQDTWESQEFGLSLLNLVIYLVAKCIRSFLSGMGSTLDKDDGCRVDCSVVDPGLKYWQSQPTLEWLMTPLACIQNSDTPKFQERMEQGLTSVRAFLQVFPDVLNFFPQTWLHATFYLAFLLTLCPWVYLHFPLNLQ